MLYILGGAPRAGKTLLSKKILAKKRIPYFPLDALIGTFTEGASELDISHEHPFVIKSQKLWKFTKHLFRFFIINEEEYLIEGDAILPAQVRELMDEGNNFRACFVGYPKLSPKEKLVLVREYGRSQKDWTNNQSDKDLLPMLERMIEYSKYIQIECEKNNIKYFDVSTDFENVLDQVFEYLVQKNVE